MKLLTLEMLHKFYDAELLMMRRIVNGEEVYTVNGWEEIMSGADFEEYCDMRRYFWDGLINLLLQNDNPGKKLQEAIDLCFTVKNYVGSCKCQGLENLEDNTSPYWDKFIRLPDKDDISEEE